jgi:hypothetical protein
MCGGRQSISWWESKESHFPWMNWRRSQAHQPCDLTLLRGDDGLSIQFQFMSSVAAQKASFNTALPSTIVGAITTKFHVARCYSQGSVINFSLLARLESLIAAPQVHVPSLICWRSRIREGSHKPRSVGLMSISFRARNPIRFDSHTIRSDRGMPTEPPSNQKKATKCLIKPNSAPLPWLGPSRNGRAFIGTGFTCSAFDKKGGQHRICR